MSLAPVAKISAAANVIGLSAGNGVVGIHHRLTINDPFSQGFVNEAAEVLHIEAVGISSIIYDVSKDFLFRDWHW